MRTFTWLFGLSLCLCLSATAQESPHGDLVARLRQAKEPDDRREAAIALGASGVRTQEAARALADALHDSDLSVRGAAARALVAFGSAAVPPLVHTLSSPDFYTKAHALGALGEIGPDAAESVDSVLAVMTDSNQEESLRRVAASALASIGEPAGPGLTRALASAEGLTRRLAATVLGQMRKVDKPVVLRLGALLADEDPAVRIAAALALYRIDKGRKDEALSVMAEALDLPTLAIRRQAMESLGYLGEDAAPAVRKIVSVTQKPQERSEFLDLLDIDSQVVLLLAAVDALARMRSPDGAPFLMGLIEAVPDAKLTALGAGRFLTKSIVRLEAVKALGAIGEDACGAVPRLVEMLKAREHATEVAETLGMIGPKASAAVPELEATVRSEAGELRTAAAAALERISAGR